MSTIERSTDVAVPVHLAYEEWARFESMPLFMEGVESVTRIDKTHLRWKVELGGVIREWDAEITVEQPDRQISWRAVTGAATTGTVHFSPTAQGTRVTFRLDYEPETFAEKAADLLGLVARRVHSDLASFKEHVESLGQDET